ncbi:diguanylate cyclase [Novosphingobium sp. SG720]|uniref:sensor domain-containing diguanylate cyclase n=1 Tax=Novosphingobium sp. SG720 TaxID=2586998 RepID=UPI0014480180|nr:diguanylate cyclase [Novosphingobium sp. SG720]NKJ42435.1 diguanylate cyclase (GGDEF)-like protein [Novosphingobium sp. SG720]
MRLTTITNWAYGVTVVLSLISGGTMLLASHAQDEERTAVAERALLDRAAEKIVEEEGALSGLARQFVISGDARDLAAYQQAGQGLRSVEQRMRGMLDAGASSDELDALKAGMLAIDELQDEQQEAITARRKANKSLAIERLFGADYERDLDRAMAQFDKFQYQLDQRTETEVAGATALARIWRSASEAALAVTASLFLCVMYFIFRRRVIHPVVKLSDVVARLAAEDYAAIPPEFAHVDEIGDMAHAIRTFRDNGLARQRLEQERSSDRAIRDMLSRMTQRMQASDTFHDLKSVIECFIPEIAPTYAGRLYLLDETRQVMVEAGSWLSPTSSPPEFPPLSCWALRRGLPHRPGGDGIDIPCAHIEEQDRSIDSICLPLTSQRETLGLLYLESHRAGESDAASEANLTVLAENIALAVANLRLREALRAMAMADPLTGLANRRHLEAVLEAEIAMAQQHPHPLSCIMVDVDHFKRFNDTYGHDAGDVVLREVASALKGCLRDGGFAARVGGEEFLLLLPGLPVEQAIDRAELMRLRISELKLRVDGGDLGTVTASFGVAGTPEICEPHKVLQTADAALLRAKKAGRNRVVCAQPRLDKAHG